jgi:hypothetical protein
MAKYRKKPVVIEAWQFSPPQYGPYTDLPDWISPAWFAEEIERDTYGRERRGSTVIQVPTLEGVMTARVGDWIIRGVKGEVYPCKPDIFEATYEPA